MAGRWTNNPHYSHAYLVPAFALLLLWFRREQLAGSLLRANWLGLVPFLGGLATRLAGTLFYCDWLEGISLLPVLAGAALLLGGWTALRWSWVSIAFLVFMIPLPYLLETGLSQPLQLVATRVSIYLLQTLGLPAFAEGNVILVNESRIGIVEACNGLGMLTLFFALATGVAILIRRPMLDKALIVVSAIPIAILTNALRITATSILHEIAGSRWADIVFHDLAGWLMMPTALGMLWVELWVLSRLLVELPARPQEKFSLARRREAKAQPPKTVSVTPA